jgi:DNA-binding NarL/FixJ family response regulator
LQLARAMNWRGGEVFCLFNYAFLLSALGDYEPALRIASDALAIAVEIEHRQWTAALHITTGAIYHDLLALTAARQHLETGLAIAHETRSLHWVHTATGFLTSVLVAQAGSEAGGAAMLERAASLLDSLPDDGSELLTLGMRLIACARVEWLLERRLPAEALDCIDQLLAADPNVAPGRPILRLAMLRGEALTMLGRHAEAEQELLAAQSLAATQGARGSLWRTLAALGNVRRALGQAAGGEQAYADARAMIAELAAPLAPESLREHFTTAALARMPEAHRPTALQAAKQAHGGLTAREREVARMIAQGKSNREIAEALVLGERTIETHVGHILGKLGFASRSQIAAWAAERGGSDPR